MGRVLRVRVRTGHGDAVMNRKLRVFALLLPALGLTACASLDERSTYVPPPQAQSQQSVEKDVAYIDKVERIARRRGIDVVWVNYPVRRLVAQQADD